MHLDGKGITSRACVYSKRRACAMPTHSPAWPRRIPLCRRPRRRRNICIWCVCAAVTASAWPWVRADVDAPRVERVVHAAAGGVRHARHARHAMTYAVLSRGLLLHYLVRCRLLLAHGEAHAPHRVCTQHITHTTHDSGLVTLPACRCRSARVRVALSIVPR